MKDAESVLAFVLIMLTFPSCYLAAFVLFAIGSITGIDRLGSGRLLVEWLVFVITGYAQWFVILPAGARRLRRIARSDA